MDLSRPIPQKQKKQKNAQQTERDEGGLTREATCGLGIVFKFLFLNGLDGCIDAKNQRTERHQTHNPRNYDEDEKQDGHATFSAISVVDGQNFRPVAENRDGVFVVRRQTAICRHIRPFIG